VILFFKIIEAVPYPLDDMPPSADCPSGPAVVNCFLGAFAIIESKRDKLPNALKLAPLSHSACLIDLPDDFDIERYELLFACKIDSRLLFSDDNIEKFNFAKLNM
jgi:hypothetical protein